MTDSNIKIAEPFQDGCQHQPYSVIELVEIMQRQRNQRKLNEHSIALDTKGVDDVLVDFLGSIVTTQNDVADFCQIHVEANLNYLYLWSGTAFLNEYSCQHRAAGIVSLSSQTPCVVGPDGCSTHLLGKFFHTRTSIQRETTSALR